MKNFLFALRYISKLRGNHLTRIVSLSLGLAVGLLLFSYSWYNLSFNRSFEDKERIWQMWTKYTNIPGLNLSNCLMAPIAPAMAEEIPQIEAATRLHASGSITVKSDENIFDARLMMVDTMFFNVFGFNIISGNPKEVLLHTDRIMVSRSFARKMFGEGDPIGRRVTISGDREVTVDGVFVDPPANQQLGKLNILISFGMADTMGYNTSWHGGDSFETYIKLKKDTSVAEVEAQLSAFFDRHGCTQEMTMWGQSYLFYNITESNLVNSPIGFIAYMLMALAALTLFVATMNYVLVSVSTLVNRSRTIAMLKVNGARRQDIFGIFCSETAMLTAISLAVAAFLIWALQEQIRAVTGVEMTDLFALGRIWVPMCVILAAFALAALIPAQIFTSVPVTLAFRGTAANRRRWKLALLFVEVFSVTLTTVMLVVFALQFDRLRNGDFGYGHDRLIITSAKASAESGRDAIMSAMASIPEVESAGTTDNIPLWDYSGMPCYDENTHELLFSCRWSLADPGYIPTMQMTMAAGENFSETRTPFDAIVNETYVKMRGWMPDDAIGRQITDDCSPDGVRYKVIGVVKDFRTTVSSGKIEPLVIHSDNMLPSYYEPNFSIVIRLRELSQDAIAAVEKKLREFPTNTNYNIDVFDELVGDELAPVRNYRNIVFTVSVIILLIGITGLIGYLSDEIRRRSKEVAIRKVNGASSGSVVWLLARNVAVICLPAIGAGIAAGYWVAGRVLTLFVERISLSWWIFAVCALAVAAVITAVQIVRTWRIAGSNPINMIKTE